MHRSALLLLPFAAFITIRILRQNVLWTDDTLSMFFDRNGEPVQTKKGESMLRRGHFWPYIARGDAPYTVFDFTVSRDRDGPMSMLSNWTLSRLWTMIASCVVWCWNGFGSCTISKIARC